MTHTHYVSNQFQSISLCNERETWVTRAFSFYFCLRQAKSKSIDIIHRHLLMTFSHVFNISSYQMRICLCRENNPNNVKALIATLMVGPQWSVWHELDTEGVMRFGPVVVLNNRLVTYVADTTFSTIYRWKSGQGCLSYPRDFPLLDRCLNWAECISYGLITHSLNILLCLSNGALYSKPKQTNLRIGYLFHWYNNIRKCIMHRVSHFLMKHCIFNECLSHFY